MSEGEKRRSVLVLGWVPAVLWSPLSERWLALPVSGIDVQGGVPLYGRGKVDVPLVILLPPTLDTTEQDRVPCSCIIATLVPEN